jgi:hypothetical protein
LGATLKIIVIIRPKPVSGALGVITAGFLVQIGASAKKQASKRILRMKQTRGIQNLESRVESASYEACLGFTRPPEGLLETVSAAEAVSSRKALPASREKICYRLHASGRKLLEHAGGRRDEQWECCC